MSASLRVIPPAAERGVSGTGKSWEDRLTLDEFFAGRDESRQIFEAVRSAIESLGLAELRTGKSQISFRRRRAFAWIWIPGRYIRGKTAPLVLTLSFGHRDASPRWKEVVEPAPGRFTHHLELHSVLDVDDEVRGWLRHAWAAAS
jgi:hypothetical protein